MTYADLLDLYHASPPIKEPTAAIDIALGDSNGSGKREITYTLGTTSYRDKLDLASGWQRQQSLERALPALGLGNEYAGTLDAELSMLASAENTTSTAETPRFIETLLTSAELDAHEFPVHWIVKNAIVANQPGIIGGREKTNKTNITVDLAISVASGTQFLGRFDTTQATVGFWCGESGKRKIQGLARRICQARELTLSQLPIYWGFDLPKLCRRPHIEAIAEFARANAVSVVIVDPLYLALLDDGATINPSNIFQMGAVLEPLSILSHEATVLLVHHFRKTGEAREDDPCPLDELSQAGIAEWSRQWILLQRRSPYASDGRHELYIRLGGSEGHSSIWSLDIDEGKSENEYGDEVLTAWDTQLERIGDAAETARQARQAKRQEEMERAADGREERIWDTIQGFPEGITARGLSDLSGINTKNTGIALNSLRKKGRVVECEVEKNHRKWDGWRPKS